VGDSKAAKGEQKQTATANAEKKRLEAPSKRSDEAQLPRPKEVPQKVHLVPTPCPPDRRVPARQCSNILLESRCATRVSPHGLTGAVYWFDSPSRVLKVVSCKSADCTSMFDREVTTYQHLQNINISWVSPTLLGVDKADRCLLMGDGGESLTSTSAPANWKEQLERLLQTLHKNGVRHNDLTMEEVRVDQHGMLTIVDWGWSSLDGDYSWGGRASKAHKRRVFVDEGIEFELQHALAPRPRTPSAEMHVFVHWVYEKRDEVMASIASHFEIISLIEYDLPKSDIKKTLDRFYAPQIATHGRKGAIPYLVITALDHSPAYEWTKVRDCKVLVNQNTFKLKHSLRKGRIGGGFLHASDNTEEALSNLRALSPSPKHAPLKLWLEWRPRFASLKSLFERMNEAEIQYVVLRNHEQFFDSVSIDEHTDIDVATNDYTRVKAIIGGVQYKHLLPKGSAGWGINAEACNGWKVANRIIVGDTEISVDIRSLGDYYYDDSWVKEMLRTRVLDTRGFYRLDEENYFYSLIYHAIAHKKKISASYWPRFRAMWPVIRPKSSKLDTLKTQKDLEDVLFQFMKARAYVLVRPLERNIQSAYFDASMSAGTVVPFKPGSKFG
jgi:hypothetical protein